MCLMVYLGTVTDLPPVSGNDLRLERVQPAREFVRRWFSVPRVHFVGAHTGCSCGFPSVIAETPVDYFDGMRLESDDRAADLRSVRALIDLVARVVERDGRVELYPVADGDEMKPPKGVIELPVESLVADRFFFNERFMHVVAAPRRAA